MSEHACLAGISVTELILRKLQIPRKLLGTEHAQTVLFFSALAREPGNEAGTIHPAVMHDLSIGITIHKKIRGNVIGQELCGRKILCQAFRRKKLRPTSSDSGEFSKLFHKLL